MITGSPALQGSGLAAASAATASSPHHRVAVRFAGNHGVEPQL